MILLCLYRPCHFKLAAVVTYIRIFSKLRGQPVRIHIFLNAVNNSNNFINVSFKFFTLLKTRHRYQVRFLIGNCIQIATVFLFLRWAFRLFWRFWPFFHNGALMFSNTSMVMGLSLTRNGLVWIFYGSQVTHNWIFVFAFGSFKTRLNCYLFFN